MYTTCSVTTSVIAALGTTPDERGLSTDQFKAKFDEFGVNFVEWFNETHIPELSSYAEYGFVTSQAIASGASGTALNLTTERKASPDTTLATGNIKILSAGTYLINIEIGFDVNSTSYRGAAISIDGGSNYLSVVRMAPIATRNSVVSLTYVRVFNVNDIITVLALQETGSPLNAIGTAYLTHVQIKKIG
jgi:hypothetical protein